MKNDFSTSSYKCVFICKKNVKSKVSAKEIKLLKEERCPSICALFKRAQAVPSLFFTGSSFLPSCTVFKEICFLKQPSVKFQGVFIKVASLESVQFISIVMYSVLFFFHNLHQSVATTCLCIYRSLEAGKHMLLNITFEINQKTSHFENFE